MKKDILGVRVDDMSLGEVLNTICHSGEGRNLYGSRVTPGMTHLRVIFTPNPEFIVEAQKNPEFKKILNSSDLNIPDGIGLQIFGGIKNRVPGYELMLKLCELAVKQNLTVGLFGGAEGVARKAKLELEKRFPGIKIKFAIDGGEADEIVHSSLFTVHSKVDFLFVALGMVKQERFLMNCKLKIVNCKFGVGMGVGGSFNELIGLERPAPKIVGQLGLKWLWRLINEPKRIKRIFNAVVVFPWLVFKSRYLN